MKLGYKNPNYISMLEKNRSTIPLTRIPDIATAYELPKEFALVMLQELYPDALRMVVQICNTFKGEELNTAVGPLDSTLKQYRRKYKV